MWGGNWSTYSSGSTANHPPGLINQGNTCFLNSVLQALARSFQFRSWSLSHTAEHEKLGQQEGCIACAVGKVMRDLRHKVSQPFAPSSITGRLRSISSSFYLGLQQDAHEFLSHLLDAMEKSCKVARMPPCTLLQGRMVSRVLCTSCRKPSDSTDLFETLSLEIGSCSTIEQALARFTAPEVLDGDNMYHCETCNGKRRAWKRFAIKEPPLVLVFHLKRFDFLSMFPRKLDHHVAFPTHLRLDPYLLGKVLYWILQLLCVSMLASSLGATWIL